LQGVAVTVRSAQQSFVDTREFLGVVVEPGLVHLTVGEVDGPAVQGGGAFMGTVTLRVEYLRVSHDVEHDRVVFVVGVERVKDVAGFEVEPPDIVGSTLAGQNSDACWVGGIPGINATKLRS
jgi:hypothetical protein